MTLGTVVEDDEFVHIMPIGDRKEHTTSCDCWCNPRADEESPDIIVHNSLDGREWNELHSKAIH